MTIRELIDELEDLASEHGDTIEVRLAIQPKWAFEYAIGNVAVVPDDDDDSDDDDDDDATLVDTSEREPVVYIGEGTQLGYLSGAATRAVWGRE